MKFAFLVSMVAFLASPAYAAIEPPYKSVEYCYRIDNISAFPDFVVIARFPSVLREYSDPIQLKEDECYVRNTRDEIVAVRGERFQASDIEAGILNSDIRTPVSPVKIYDPQDPRTKIEDIFTIDALDDQTFSLRLAKKITTLDDGTSEEKVYATAEEGLADPPGPGYEYQDDFGGEGAYVDPNEGNELINIILPALAFVFYIYVAAALFTLARRLNARHRWRAWVPIVNIYLLIRLSEKRWHWFVLLLIVPLIVWIVAFTVSDFFWEAFYWYDDGAELIVSTVVATLLLFEYTLIERVITGIVIRCGRPWWWGPLMVLVPPVGLVLLGIIAWSKKTQQSLPVNT